MSIQVGNKDALFDTFRTLAQRQGERTGAPTLIPGTRPIIGTPPVLEHTRVKPFHPAFDIRDDVMVVGYDVERPEHKTIVRKPFHIVSVGGKVEWFEGDETNLDGRLIRLLSLTGPLPLIDVEVSRSALIRFIQDAKALSERELYDRLIEKVNRHLDFAHRGQYVIVVAWTVMTYVYPLFTSLPYLHLLGAKNTGKSQALDLLAQVARSGLKTRATAAVIGDLIEAARPTLLFDQADNLTDEHINLLADSYRAGATRTLVVFDSRGERQARTYETFGPKVFAGTTALDEDLADRAILITTSPATRIVEAIAPGDKEARDLRSELYKWAFVNFLKLSGVAPFTDRDWAPLGAYKGRQRDLWRPIETIMEVLDVPEVDREAAREYYGRSQAATTAELREDHVQLLKLLLRIVGEEPSAEVSSTQLLTQLGSDVYDFDDPFGWSPQKLGVALRTLNVLKSKARTTTRNERRYVIDGEAVRETARRYGVTV